MVCFHVNRLQDVKAKNEWPLFVWLSLHTDLKAFNHSVREQYDVIWCETLNFGFHVHSKYFVLFHFIEREREGWSAAVKLLFQTSTLWEPFMKLMSSSCWSVSVECIRCWGSRCFIIGWYCTEKLIPDTPVWGRGRGGEKLRKRQNQWFLFSFRWLSVFLFDGWMEWVREWGTGESGRWVNRWF